MSAPRTITKVITGKAKYEVTYTSSVDAAQYYIFELSRAAMRDVGKFLAKAFKVEYYKHFNRHTGNAGRATKYKVFSSKNTKYPRVQIGLQTGAVPGFYAYFQEFGTSKQPKLALLTSIAHDNVAKIVEIESQYLSGLSEEAAALAAQIDDGQEYEGDADGED